MRWLRGLGLVGAVVMATTALANPVRANPGVTPGMKSRLKTAHAQRVSRLKATTAAITS
jgi:hypothetical protein